MYNKKELIKKILEVSFNSKEGHIASSLSILDILYTLYNDVMNIDSIKHGDNDRDRLILSKGHASLGLYTILNQFNLLTEDVNNFCKFDSKLGGHPTHLISNVECSTGSLGHGLPIGVGMALSYKIQKYDHKIYVIIGDGETNEGTIWESALLANQYNLNNLTCILDYNHSTDRALNIENVATKFNSFGWNVCEIDGHCVYDIKNSLLANSDKPKMIIANTIKGKGCEIMENNPEWHHKSPNIEEYQKIINSL